MFQLRRLVDAHAFNSICEMDVPDRRLSTQQKQTQTLLRSQYNNITVKSDYVFITLIIGLIKDIIPVFIVLLITGKHGNNIRLFCFVFVKTCHLSFCVSGSVIDYITFRMYVGEIPDFIFTLFTDSDYHFGIFKLFLLDIIIEIYYS